MQFGQSSTFPFVLQMIYPSHVTAFDVLTGEAVVCEEGDKPINFEAVRPLFDRMFGTEWIVEPPSEPGDHESASTDDASLMQYANRQLVPFNVADAVDLFVKLDAVCFSLLKHSRVTICPFGPKIFSAVSLLVGIAYFPRIAIWRITGNIVSEPVDRLPAGPSFAISATPN